MSSAPIRVQALTTRRQRRAFLLFPWRIYRGVTNWVPPVLRDRAARLDPRQNPFFEYGEAEAFVAEQNGRVVGTIAAAVDHRANQVLNQAMANFGFFECAAEYPVAEALLDRAVAWGRDRKLELLRGPQSFSSSDEPGLLVEGRATPPGLLMGWTQPYYEEFFARYGLRKYCDSLAYRVYLKDLPVGPGGTAVPAKIERVAQRAAERYGYSVRCGNIAEWDAEMGRARTIYNRALATLPDFVPMGEDEWRQQAHKLRPLIDPEMVLFAQVNGREVGFGLALPDVNQALWHCNGLRYPWNYAQLWWYSRRLPGLSFKIMAMEPEYWGRGLDALIYLEIARAALRKGYEWVDLSLTGEDNPMTNKMMANVDAQVDKRYRVYELDIVSGG